ncbi:MAG: thermonuclease family protein [Deltaproteobacteria bacterium]|nr:thermonuclease family protein [Deltaproteobacteria bacterium]
MRIKIILFFTLILFSSPPLLGSSFKYKAVSILDGDTFTATDGNVTFKVRIAAMDAPEKGQPYSKLATFRLKQILASANVTIKPVGKGSDRYGRVLGAVFVGEEDVALTMIQEGLATYYRPLCRDYPEDKGKYNYNPERYVQAEKEAKDLQKNIWSLPSTELPCRYRHSGIRRREK